MSYMSLMCEMNLAREVYSVLKNCNFPHTSYLSVSNAYLTNIQFPVTISTSGQNSAVGIQVEKYYANADGGFLA